MDNREAQMTLDGNEVLQVVNDAVFNYQGKYLTDVQEKLLMGALKGLTYEEMAQELGYSYGHLSRSVGYKLWKLLSQALGETVQKNNLRGSLRRAIEKAKSRSINYQSKENYWVNLLTHQYVPSWELN